MISNESTLRAVRAALLTTLPDAVQATPASMTADVLSGRGASPRRPASRGRCRLMSYGIEQPTKCGELRPNRLPLEGRQCRCEGCGHHFNSESVFARHRVGNWAVRGSNRRCLAPEEMRARGWQLNAKGFWIERRRPPGHLGLQPENGPTNKVPPIRRGAGRAALRGQVDEFTGTNASARGVRRARVAKRGPIVVLAVA
jgi:hypothetical protein